MTVTLTPEIEKLIQDHLKSGPYKSAEDLVNAALSQFMGDDFMPGELDKLLAVGESQARAGKFVQADEVFRQIQARSEARRNRP
jgi:Arc/MetJ-type ribon-helix-helix transcriptional regulator